MYYSIVCVSFVESFVEWLVLYGIILVLYDVNQGLHIHVLYAHVYVCVGHENKAII